MKVIPFVRKEHYEVARSIESKLLAISAEAGILFVGVDVTPTEAGQDPVYSLLVGIDWELKVEDAIPHLVTLAISEELLLGADVRIEVRRGRTKA